MVMMKAVTFLAGLAFIIVDAAPSGEVESAAATTTYVPPPSASCGLEGKKKDLSQFLPFLSINDIESVSACAEVCYDYHHQSLCESIQYNPSTRSCAVWATPVNRTMDPLDGTGLYYWDRECFPLEPAPPPTGTSAPLPCLPSDVVCGLSGSLSTFDPFSTFYYIDDAAACYAICTDEHHSPRCVSYAYSEGSRPRCTFYDHPLAGYFSPSEGSNWYWDVACLGNSGPCE